MSMSGKYDFPGIKRLGALGLRSAFGIPSNSFFDLILEFIANVLANRGLILLNVGAIYVNGEIDQAALDRAIESGIQQVEKSNGKLTPKQIKDIDDAVIKAADKALPYSGSV